VSDIDTVVVESLKALDPNRPIREADSTGQGCVVVSRAGRGIDNCDGDRHLYVEAGGQKHTQWLAPVSRAASPYRSL
jgi:hypothetical protein